MDKDLLDTVVGALQKNWSIIEPIRELLVYDSGAHFCVEPLITTKQTFLEKVASVIGKKTGICHIGFTKEASGDIDRTREKLASDFKERANIRAQKLEKENAEPLHDQSGYFSRNTGASRFSRFPFQGPTGFLPEFTPLSSQNGDASESMSLDAVAEKIYEILREAIKSSRINKKKALYTVHPDKVSTVEGALKKIIEVTPREREPISFEVVADKIESACGLNKETLETTLKSEEVFCNVAKKLREFIDRNRHTLDANARNRPGSVHPSL